MILSFFSFCCFLGAGKGVLSGSDHSLEPFCFAERRKTTIQREWQKPATAMEKNASSMQAITDWPRRNSRDPGKTSPDWSTMLRMLHGACISRWLVNDVDQDWGCLCECVCVPKSPPLFANIIWDNWLCLKTGYLRTCTFASFLLCLSSTFGPHQFS